jgi:hypothetical protein
MPPPPKEKPPSLRTGVDRFGLILRTAPVDGSNAAVFPKGLLPREFARTAHGFGGFAGFLHGRFLEMLLELHFTKHTFPLKFFLQGAKGLFDVIVTNADLHVVVTTFLS